MFSTGRRRGRNQKRCRPNLDASPDAVRKTPFEFTSRWLAYSERTNTGDVTVEAAIDAAGARTQSGETEQL
jgi:hypothetical protein